MLTVLLVVIFIAFIGVGLPDSVLGPAWPAMYKEFGLPISTAGYISASVSVGTIVSSLLAARLIKKLGTGLLVAISTLLTAFALLGFAFTENFVFFFFLAIPLGLGAGAVDTALNSFVALHYSASQISFLHCFYGVGVAASPFIMSLALGDENNWRRGYFVVALIQFFITAVTFIALPWWKKVQEREADKTADTVKNIGIKHVVKTKGVMFSAMSFFGICALELTVGGWSSSYFVNTKGLNPDNAAIITMILYIGLALGRFLSGLLAGKLGRRNILKISLLVLVASVFVFALPLPMAVGIVALFFMGVSIGPAYPNLVHLTPTLFGEDIAESVMGVQQAFTYLGVMLMPWLFGVLANAFSTVLLPYYLIAMLIIYIIPFVLLLRSANKKG